MTIPTGRFTVLAPLLLSCVSVPLQADHWLQFRGNRSDGVAESKFPETWSSSRNVRWKISVPGEGWSCPVVFDDRVFLTTAINTDAGDEDSSRPEPYRGGGGRRRSDLTEANYRWEVLCLDAKTGNIEWRRTAREGHPPIPRHSSNSYATETPVTDGERVYAYFGMMGLYCYDITGNLQWKKDLENYEMRAGWGTSSSPVLFDGKLYLQVDNDEQSFLVAFEAKSGKEIWRIKRDEPSQYSSPIIWQNSQRNEVITGGQFCRSYDPATGKLLWELDMAKGRSSATPLAVGDRLYVGTEFRNRGGSDDGGGFLFAVRPGGTGNITPPAEATAGEHVEWKIARSGIQMASPVLCAGRIYLLERRSGIIHCVDAKTGATLYRSRIPGARAFWASPWTDGEHIYCLDADGTTHILASGPELSIIGTNEMDEQTWSSPAIANGALFVRTINHLYCISKKP